MYRRSSSATAADDNATLKRSILPRDLSAASFDGVRTMCFSPSPSITVSPASASGETRPISLSPSYATTDISRTDHAGSSHPLTVKSTETASDHGHC